jgi:hypothetical protein
MSDFVFMRSRSNTPKRGRSCDRHTDSESELQAKRHAFNDNDNDKENGMPEAGQVDNVDT